MATKTSYSVQQGGGRGYINIGGWNTTLTEVSTAPKEVVGITRYEGANRYMYVCGGLESATKGYILAVKTAVTDLDTGAAIPPICLTAMPVTDNIALAFGMAICTLGTQLYGWVLREGVATGYAGTDSALTTGARYVYGAATAHLLGAATSSGQAVSLVGAATSVVSATGTGGLVYLRFGR